MQGRCSRFRIFSTYGDECKGDARASESFGAMAMNARAMLLAIPESMNEIGDACDSESFGAMEIQKERSLRFRIILSYGDE
jgi:hypothetical protein